MSNEPNNGAPTSDVQREVRLKVATPTPWTVEFSNEHAPDLAYIRAANRQEVAVVYASSLMPHVPPLIAAAPDLLAALKALCDWDWSSLLVDHPDAAEVLKAVQLGDAAIARAEGRS